MALAAAQRRQDDRAHVIKTSPVPPPSLAGVASASWSLIKNQAAGRGGQSAVVVCCTLPCSSEGWKTQPNKVFLRNVATTTGRLAGRVMND